MGFCLPVTIGSPLRGCRYLILEPSLLCSLGQCVWHLPLGRSQPLDICLKLGHRDLEYIIPDPEKDAFLSSQVGKLWSCPTGGTGRLVCLRVLLALCSGMMSWRPVVLSRSHTGVGTLPEQFVVPLTKRAISTESKQDTEVRKAVVLNQAGTKGDRPEHPESHRTLNYQLYT